MDSTCRVIMEKWVVPLRSQILVWVQMILRHRLMLRDQDILFQEKETLDPLVREKLLHALASVASQACLSACFALSWPLTGKNLDLFLLLKGYFSHALRGPRGFVLLNIVYAYFVDRCRKSKIWNDWGWENPAENREMGGHRSYHHQTSTRERALSRSLKIQIQIRASVGSRTGDEGFLLCWWICSTTIFYSYSLAVA